MAENNALRHLISDAADQLTSELYTDDKVQDRVKTWEKGTPNPSAAEQYAYLMAENRNYAEELVYRVLAKLADDGLLKTPEEP
ncbi:hypothetical protein [Lacticaseibacillus yichunensis]|uniref:Transcriptional regulator n=1 Tax=Lacticaseibacillus yichunensis TaxID=2486015 RepID=A0ABW4CLQ4_9LACO|nr:hypothetical protein [Lacticaseibacillus yichunensis]